MRNKKNWRRIMALVLIVAMLVSAPMAYAIEVAAEPGMEVYTESEVTDIDDFDIVGGTLNRYTGKATKVVIPEMVTSIGSSAFSGCSSLTEITIPEGVTSIGDCAFLGCNSLSEIVLPNQVTRIGYGAFSRCNSLSEIVIPERVTIIEGEAFSGCSSLGEIIIPKSVTSIGTEVFSNCLRLITIKVEEGNTVYDSRENCNAVIETESNMLISGCKNTIIPEEVTSIGSSAFAGCNDLTEIVIPERVTSIGDSAFSACSSLTEIVIPEGVTSIGSSAFAGCNNLTEIVIPEEVVDIGSSVFSDCSSLTAIKVEDGNTVYDSRENCNAVIEIESNTLISGCKNTIIPEGVTNVGGYAFAGCSGLTEIMIPEGVTSIGGYAFKDCSGLTEIVIPEGVMSIGFEAFRGCSSLMGITIPNSVTVIGRYAFMGCRSLTEIVIPKGLTSIGESAFRDCSSMTAIKVEEGNPVYDSRENCNAVIETESNTLISGCKNTVIPEEVTGIGRHAFSGSDLTEIVISERVTSIAVPVFRGCSSLSVIKVEEGNPVYDSRENCNAIIETENNTLISGCKNTIIPEGVTRIGDSAFYECRSLTEIVIPEGVTSMGQCVFCECSSLVGVTIPESVTSIDHNAFSQCSEELAIYGKEGSYAETYAAENNIKFSAGEMPHPGEDKNKCGDNLTWRLDNDGTLTISGTGEMYDFINGRGRPWEIDGQNIKSVVIEEGVTSVGSRAFYGYSSLGKIAIPKSVTIIGDFAFAGCDGLTEIVIPEGVASIGDQAFLSCSSLLEIIIPKSVTSINGSAFQACSGLETIKVEDGNIKYDSRKNCNAIIETESSTLIRGCKNTIIPKGVTAIGILAFRGCSGLTSIVIPEGVTSIGRASFRECSDLIGISIPESVTSIKAPGLGDYNENLTIYGKAGSYAETYATEHNIKFSTGEMPKPGEEKTISDSDVSLSRTTYTYDGTEKKPSVTVKDGIKTLTKDTDYTVTYINNINAGAATVLLQGIGQYTDTRSVEFTINKATPTLKFTSINVSKTLGEDAFTNDVTADTDGTLTYTSTNPSVATVDKSSGLVTLKGTGTATITANAAEGQNYTSKSASYELTVEQPPSTDLSSLTYSFGNSRYAFGYNTSYKIPLSSYQMVFSDVKAKSLFDNLGGAWGGSCYGMSSTSGMFNTKNSGMVVGDFNAAANKVSDLKVADKNNKLDIILRTWIEAMHVSQYDSSIQRCFAYNEELDSICAEVNRGLPVIIGVWGPEGGHAIVGYKVEKISAAQSYLYVYDCNFPNQIRTVTLTTDRSGSCTGWYYHLNDRYDWGSAYRGCSIAYVPYSCYQAMWKNSPAARKSVMPFAYKVAALSNLTGDVSDSQNMLMVNSDEFSIQDQSGIVVAEVKNGQLTAGKQGIYQFRPTDLMLDDEKKDSEDKILIYLPTDAYMIKSTDDSTDKLEIGMVNENQSIDVATTADDVTVHVDDSEKRNIVNIHADKGDSYEVVLNSSLENAKNMEEITVSGTAANNTVEVGMTENGCVLKNCMDIQMKINGQGLGSTIGSLNDISKMKASLEYVSCDYDGKNKEPQVVLKDGSYVLKNGTDYVVIYNNNVEPGTATATVYGIVNYAGMVSLDYIIKGKDSNAALAEIKNKAKRELNAYKKPEDYRETQKKELIKAIGDGRNAIDSAKDELGVKKALSDAKAVIDRIKTNAQLAEEEERARINISSCKVILSKTSYTHDGRKKEPVVNIKAGKTKLIKNADYTVSYKNNDKVGTASVVISGKGKYTGKVTNAFKILPQGTSISGKITAKSKGFTVKWKKQKKSTTGYQIQYSTSKKFMKKMAVTKTVKKNSTTKLTVKNLKAKKKYYVRIRTYKTVGGKKYYSNWSKSQKVETKK